MIKIKSNDLLEYLSLTLILSYFFIHNIFLVLIGICFSLYFININSINNLISIINKNLFIRKASVNLNKKDNSIESNSINMNINKEDEKLTLVEKIEELGFIPSINNNIDAN